MKTTTFDTYELIREFKQVGFDEQQAEVQVHTVKLIVDTTVEQFRDEIQFQNFATHNDVKEAKRELREEIKELKNEMMVKFEKVQVEIVQSKNSCLLWMFSMLITQTAFIFGFFGNAIDLF